MDKLKPTSITLTMYYCTYEYKFGDGLYLYLDKKRSDGADFDGEKKITWTYLAEQNTWETMSKIDGVDTKKELLNYLNKEANVNGEALKISWPWQF